MKELTLEGLKKLLSSEAVYAALRYGYKNGVCDEGVFELVELYEISKQLRVEARNKGE